MNWSFKKAKCLQEKKKNSFEQNFCSYLGLGLEFSKITTRIILLYDLTLAVMNGTGMGYGELYK